MPLKEGPNFQDCNRIREYVEAGETDPEVIGRNLSIKPQGVSVFIETISKPTRGQKAAATRAANKAAKEQEESEEETEEAGE